VVHVPQTTQNVVISRCGFGADGKKCTKNYNAHIQPLFCSLNLLFSEVPVAIAVVAFLKLPNMVLKGREWIFRNREQYGRVKAKTGR